MNFKSMTAVAGAAAFSVALLLWWSARPSTPEHVATDARTAITTPVQSVPATVSTGVTSPAPVVVQTTATKLDDLATRLNAAQDAEASRKILVELRAMLDALPREIASREVQSFLSLKKDAVTKLDVTVKAGGALGDASSLRVFLLDYLGQVDRLAAAALGKEILSIPTSPDEWAVSLRNVAWADDSPGNLAYLRAKAREMITHRAWQQNPSSGFLEAFDVIVHAKGVDLAPQLTELVRDKENRAVAHAAYLTLDRLTIADPAAALAPLAARPEMMDGREQTRANFFARADVRDAGQRKILESYLLDPQRSTQEMESFARIFPNANYMISNNLLTPMPTPDHAELTQRDHAALKVVKGWLADPRFTRLKPQIEEIHGRLQTFVQQASADPR